MADVLEKASATSRNSVEAWVDTGKATSGNSQAEKFDSCGIEAHATIDENAGVGVSSEKQNQVSYTEVEELELQRLGQADEHQPSTSTLAERRSMLVSRNSEKSDRVSIQSERSFTNLDLKRSVENQREAVRVGPVNWDNVRAGSYLKLKPSSLSTSKSSETVSKKPSRLSVKFDVNVKDQGSVANKRSTVRKVKVVKVEDVLAMAMSPEADLRPSNVSQLKQSRVDPAAGRKKRGRSSDSKDIHKEFRNVRELVKVGVTASLFLIVSYSYITYRVFSEDHVESHEGHIHREDFDGPGHDGHDHGHGHETDHDLGPSHETDHDQAPGFETDYYHYHDHDHDHDHYGHDHHEHDH